MSDETLWRTSSDDELSDAESQSQPEVQQGEKKTRTIDECCGNPPGTFTQFCKDHPDPDQYIAEKQFLATPARCRWCDKNDVPISDMAIFSYKESFGGYTGVCKKCINSEEAEKQYHLRMSQPEKPSLKSQLEAVIGELEKEAKDCEPSMRYCFNNCANRLRELLKGLE